LWHDKISIRRAEPEHKLLVLVREKVLQGKALLVLQAPLPEGGGSSFALFANLAPVLFSGVGWHRRRTSSGSSCHESAFARFPIRIGFNAARSIGRTTDRIFVSIRKTRLFSNRRTNIPSVVVVGGDIWGWPGCHRERGWTGRRCCYYFCLDDGGTVAPMMVLSGTRTK